MYENQEYMNSSEQLVAFLDGELSQEESTNLFYELAQNSELQDEMRQYVQLRNSLRNSKVIAPPHLKENILKSTGLKEGPFSGLIDMSGRASAMLIALFYNRISLSVMVITMLSLGYIFYINNSGITIEEKAGQMKPENTLAKSKIPVSESYEIGSFDENNREIASNNLDMNGKSNAGNSNKNNKVAKLSGISSRNSNFINSNISDNSTNSMTDLAVSNLDDNIDVNQNYSKVDFSEYNNNFEMFDFKNGISKRKHFTAESMTWSHIMENTSIYFRKFMANSYPNFNLGNESNPLINDIVFGIRYNLNPNHSVGIALGFENFRMTFDKEIDGIVYGYNQVWNGQWLALSYQYTMDEIGNSGFSPEFNALIGSTIVGPIMKGGVGANYSITESFYLNAGIELGMLLYNENQAGIGGKWFNTNKIGYSIGFGIGL
jgi:hypothetical protein